MPRKTVIFDLDGTIADTSGDLIAAANAAFATLGYAPQLEMGRDDATAFAGGRAMLKLSCERLDLPDTATVIEDGYPILLRAYGDAIDTHTTLYPGVIDAVERLHRANMAVGICTNKPEALAVTLTQRLGIAELFTSLIGADTLPTRKPDPAPYLKAVEQAGGSVSHSTLIGDTITDRKTAKAAGVPSVLVTFGPSGEAVADLAPEALLDHYDDLDRVLGMILP